RRAQERGLDVREFTVESLAETDESRFDVVCGFQVLEHVPNPRGFLTSAARLLRPGGLLIIAVPSEESFLAYEVNNVLNMPPHHVTRWTDAALTNAAKITGLQLHHLEHERLSQFNAVPYAKARVFKAMSQRLGIQAPTVSRAAASIVARALVRAASLPLEWQIHRGKVQALGHSVIASYRKP